MSKHQLQSNKVSFRSPYLSYYDNHSSDIEKFEFYENLAALRNVTVDHVQNQKLRLQDFVQTLDDYEEAEAAIVNTSPYQDGNHAIQLMSAHKSKGLEFKHVYMIAVDDAAWGRRVVIIIYLLYRVIFFKFVILGLPKMSNYVYYLLPSRVQRNISS